MKNSIKYLAIMLCAMSLFACKDHIPTVEELPSESINFAYEVYGDSVYYLDYYIGSQIRFYPTVALTDEHGDLTWNFGDGSADTIGDEVFHRYSEAGIYQVTVTSSKGKKTNSIKISDILPIVTIVQEDSLCAVNESYISFDVELPNPNNLPATFKWILPQGTKDTANVPKDVFEGTAEELGKIKFSRVGSQTVTLQTTLGGRALGEVKKNVQVAMTDSAPTLYYAVKEGNIMAIKIPQNKPAGISIDPYDMGVSSGQHPFNILMHENKLYILDAGKNFTYQNEDGQLNGGDGQITIMAADASTVEPMISNVGGPAFQDPFFGYIENGVLYFSDRNTGIIKVPLATRNETYSADKFEYLVQNNYLGYYGRGLSYGAITSCFGKVKDTYYWAKTYNGAGIWRFKQSDILPAPVTETDLAPTAGAILTQLGTTFPKAFVYDEQRDKFYVSFYGDSKYEGFYACAIADLEKVVTGSDLPEKAYFDESKTKGCPQIVENSKGEGSTGEYIGICQLALDKATGNVYFGLRSADEAKIPSGLVMYDATNGNLKYLIEGIKVYGVAINENPTQLF